MPWGLASNGRQIPQVVGNIDNAQDGMELLESGVVRPRQARYQAALRPDMKCTTHSKALSNFLPTPTYGFLALTVRLPCIYLLESLIGP
jgi:hypothetical protein